MLLTVLALLAFPTASFGAVTTGSNLSSDPSANIACAGNCTYAQEVLGAAQTAGGGLTSPIDGVIVRWRLKAASAGGTVHLRVLRPSGGATFAGVGTSEPRTALIGTNLYPTRLAGAKRRPDWPRQRLRGPLFPQRSGGSGELLEPRAG